MADITTGTFETLAEMIKSRKYLLDFQKDALVNDLRLVKEDAEQMEILLDRVFFRLFGKGWNELTVIEQRDAELAWKGK